jgi:hypothetical protein
MVDGTTRSELMQRALLTGGGVTVAGIAIGALPDLAGSKPSAAQDAKILNFALLLEYVQAGLYADVLRRNVLTGELRRFAEVVGGQERAHISFIRKALGDTARKPPKLDFGDDTATAESFTDAALKLEDLGVAAYNAQAPSLTRDSLAAAARIVSVEARHASWIRAIAGVTPAPDASEPIASSKRVSATLEGSGYVR